MQIHELNKQPTNTLLTEKDVNEVSQAKLASIRKKAVAEKAKDTAEYQRAINKALPADPGTNQQAQQAVAPQPAPVQAEPDQQKQLKPTLAQSAKGLISTRQQVINKAMTDRDPNGAVQQRARAQLAQLQKEIPADMLNNPASQSNRSNNYIDKLVRLGDRQTVINPTGNTDVDDVLKQLGFLI